MIDAGEHLLGPTVLRISRTHRFSLPKVGKPTNFSTNVLELSNLAAMRSIVLAMPEV